MRMNKEQEDRVLSDLVLFMFGNHLHYNTMYENISHSDEATFTLYDMIQDTAHDPNEVSCILGVMIKQELIRWQGMKTERHTTNENTPVDILDPYFVITIHGIIEYYDRFGKKVKKV